MAKRARNPHRNKVRGSKQWATEKEKTLFFEGLKRGLSVRQAAEELGFSRSWGDKLCAANPVLKDTAKAFARQVRQADFVEVAARSGLPRPKSYDDLEPIAREALADFNLWSEMFLVRRPSPWRREAAMRFGEALVEARETKTRILIDLNVFPGAGKTTLFTHDIPGWLVCGGFTEDPQIGRALRFMLGSETKNVSKHFTGRVRRTLERRRPFWDKTQQKAAEYVLTQLYGYFKPDPMEGDEATIWRIDEFIVAQLANVDYYEMEPTFQAASYESGFLGDRCDFGIWDDLTTKNNTRTVTKAEEVAEFIEDAAETRVEPGGVFSLVGQRLNNLDAHRFVQKRTALDPDTGQERKVYRVIKFPAHWDAFCDGDHRQWDGTHEPGHGCLTDEWRKPWTDLVNDMAKPNYRTVQQQEDADPEAILVQREWIEGGLDHEGFPAVGCYDHTRGFWEWPDRKGLVTYATVDPAAGNFWAVEVWAIDPKLGVRWLIYGTRRKMQAGHFLDFDPDLGEHIGLMEELQRKTGELGHAITTWCIEAVAAFKFLFQNKSYERWRRKWPRVSVIAHDTQKNKADPQMGVEATLPIFYKRGLKRLPKRPGDLEQMRYVAIKVEELTTYPFGVTWDTVMSDWFGEFNIEYIIRQGKKAMTANDHKMTGVPEYLLRQQKEVQL